MRNVRPDRPWPMHMNAAGQACGRKVVIKLLLTMPSWATVAVPLFASSSCLSRVIRFKIAFSMLSSTKRTIVQSL